MPVTVSRATPCRCRSPRPVARRVSGARRYTDRGSRLRAPVPRPPAVGYPGRAAWRAPTPGRNRTHGALVDRVEQQVRIDRLLDVAVDADFDGAHEVIGLVVGGDHDDRHLLANGLDVAGHLQAVHVRGMRTSVTTMSWCPRWNISRPSCPSTATSRRGKRLRRKRAKASRTSSSSSTHKHRQGAKELQVRGQIGRHSCGVSPCTARTRRGRAGMHVVATHGILDRNP